MPKDLKIAYLLDFYGNMLTDKQREIVEYYYNDDLSLSEIATNLRITRQGVRDAIKKSENFLFSMEEKLGLMDKFWMRKKKFEDILALTEKILEENKSCSNSKLIKESVLEIEDITRSLL